MSAGKFLVSIYMKPSDSLWIQFSDKIHRWLYMKDDLNLDNTV